MAIQNSYAATLRAGVPGAIVNMVPKTIISRNVEDADGIGFGVPAFQGATDKGIAKTGDDLVGITLLDRSVLTGSGYSQYESARLMTEGTFFLISTGAVAVGDPVAINGVTIANSRYDTSATAAGQVVECRLGVVSTVAAG